MLVKIASPRALEVIGTDAEGRNVRMTRGAYQWVYDVWRRLGGDTDAVETAQTTATAAAESTHYWKFSPSQSFVWNSDTAGVFPTGDPTQDIVASLFDPDGNTVSTVTLRGALSSAGGTISSVSTISTTGIVPTVTIVGTGESSARADVSVELSSGKQIEAAVSWVAFDESVAGGTPASGGSK